MAMQVSVRSLGALLDHSEYSPRLRGEGDLELQETGSRGDGPLTRPKPLASEASRVAVKPGAAVYGRCPVTCPLQIETANAPIVRL